MRNKHKHVTQVTMEAERLIPPEIESTLAKAKQLTGRDFRTRFVQEKLAFGKYEKLKHCQGKGESVHLDSKKKRYIEDHLHPVSKKKKCLKKKYLQHSRDKVDSAREDIDEDTSNLDEGRSPILYDKLKDVNSDTPLQQQLSVENKTAGSDMDDLVNEIRRNCDKRMKKLIRKQEKEIQEFNEAWEEKMSKLNKDHASNANIIRAMYGNDPATTVIGLKRSGDKHAKTVAENKHLKDMQLKDLEAEQLAERNEENQKAANWLSEVEACISGKLMRYCEAGSLGAQGENVSECSESRTPTLGIKDAVPLAGEHVESINLSRNLQGKHVLESNNSDCATADQGCNEGGTSFSDTLVPAVVKQSNQPKHFCDGDSICANESASFESIPGEMKSHELHGDIAAELPESVVNDILDNAKPVDYISNSPNEGFTVGDATDLPDALLNQRNETDGTTIDDVDLAGQVLGTSAQTKALAHPYLPSSLEVYKNQEMVSSKVQGCGNSSPSEAVISEHVDTATNFPWKEVAASERVYAAASDANSELVGNAQTLQSNIELQDQVDPPIETQRTSSIEVAASEDMNQTSPSQSSMVPLDEDILLDKDQVELETQVSNSGLSDVATPVQSHINAPAIEKWEQLLLAPIDESSSCSQMPSIELENQSHYVRGVSSGAAEIEMPSHGSTSQLTEGAESQSNNLDMGLANQSSLDTSAEISVRGVSSGAAEIAMPSHGSTSQLTEGAESQSNNLDMGLGNQSSLDTSAEISVRGVSSGAAEIEMPSHGSTSQLTEGAESQSNNLDMGLGNQSSLDTSAEISVIFQNNAALEIEILHRDDLQLSGVSHLPIHEIAVWNYPSLFPDPILNDLEISHKETAELQRGLENTMSCLNSEREKEIQEVIAEVKHKYKLKLEDAEAQFRLKNNELSHKVNKILMNKLLADSFSYNSFRCSPAGSQLRQGSPSISMQQQQLFSRSTGAMAFHPSPNLENASLNEQAVQQIPAAPSTGPSQIYTSPSMQAQHAAAFSSYINANHLTTDPLFRGDVHSSAPHFQGFIPSSPQSMPAVTGSSFLRNQNHQQSLQNRHPLGHPETNSSFGLLQQSYFLTD